MKPSYLVIGGLALLAVILFEKKTASATPALSASGQATVAQVTGIATGVESIVSGLENMFKGPSRPASVQSTQIYQATSAPISTDLVLPSPVPILENTSPDTVDLTVGALPTDTLYSDATL